MWDSVSEVLSLLSDRYRSAAPLRYVVLRTSSILFADTIVPNLE